MAPNTHNRISPAFRGFAHSLFSRGPLLRLGRRYYSSVSKYAAKRFLSAKGVKDALLRGAVLERCLPAVSDLDFTLTTENQRTTSDELELLRELRHRYQSMQRRLFILGEVLILSADTQERWDQFGPAIALLQVSQHRFNGSDWRFSPMSPSRPLRSLSRFGLCWQYYTLAFRKLRQNRRGKRALFFEMFLRNASKVVSYSQGNQVSSLPAGTPAAILTKSFLALDALAKTANLEGPRVSFPLSLEISTPGETSALGEMANELWLARFRSRFGKSFLLSPTSTPGLVLWEGLERMEEGDLLEFFTCYETSLSSPILHPPLIVSPQMYQCYRKGYRGWGSDHIETGLSLVDPLQSQHVYESLFERVISYLGITPGILVQGSSHEIKRHLDALSFGAALVCSKSILSDRPELIAASRLVVPSTSEYLADQGGGTEGKTLGALIQRTMNILDEVRGWIRAHPLVEPSSIGDSGANSWG